MDGTLSFQPGFRMNFAMPPAHKYRAASIRNWVAAVLMPLGLLSASGCAYYDKLRGTGFHREPVSGSMRGSTDDAKPSGFFTDKRSDEIEKNLGGFD